VEKSSRLPAYFPERLTQGGSAPGGFLSIRQRVQVIRDPAAYEEWLARQGGKPSLGNADARVYAHRHGRVWSGGPETGPPPDEPPIDWDDKAAAENPRVMVLGDPGLGKSWQLRHRALELAQAALKAIELGPVSPAEVFIPILARLSDVAGKLEAGAGGLPGPPIVAAIVRAAAPAGSGMIQNHLASRMEAGQAALLLDALDEIHPDKWGALLEALEELGSGTRAGCSVMLSSRIAGYLRSPVRGLKAFELLPFDQPRIEGFARAWLGKRAGRFMNQLKDEPAVRGLAQVPLLLTLLCRMQEEPHRRPAPLPSRRGELYERCLRGMVHGWVEEKHRSFPEHVEPMLSLLGALALEVTLEGADTFTGTDLYRVLDKWRPAQDHWKSEFGRALVIKAPDELLARFLRDGVVVATRVEDDPPLMFLHRTFQEYLAARFLAELEERQGWKRVGPFLEAMSWDPAWREVIVLTAGQLKNPDALLSTLCEKGRDDLLRARLRLGIECLGELAEKPTRNDRGVASPRCWRPSSKILRRDGSRCGPCINWVNAHRRR
jgi:predicted NACHT family NTPase